MAGNMIGRVFSNRYQITELIGVGGMAEVYRAQDNVLGRVVAVKVMLPQYASDTEFTRRFKQEAASAANLQSPYIVNIYDWGQDEGTYFIVMEYVRGSDLKTAINQRGAINQRKVAEIGSQVCQALSVAHGLDIIHRDIKPQNIMVQPDGNVKVMDFGIARAKNSVEAKTSSVLGTAHYISPEQAQGKELTPASDIYSLGVVMYEAATGKLPFDGPDAVSVAMKQVQEQPKPPREVNPNIDPTLEAIILKAMEKQPSKRFTTAKDMRRALNNFLAGRPVVLNNDEHDFTSAQTSVIHTVAAPTPIPVEQAYADGTAVMQPVNQQATNPTPQKQQSFSSENTQPKKNNKKTIGIAILCVAALAAIACAAAFAMGAFGGGNNSANTATVPNVVGKSQTAASTELANAGFEVGDVDTQVDESVDVGTVLSQDPSGDSTQTKGSKVNLVVAKAQDQVEVPDLTGRTADEARKLLTASGLKYVAGTAEYSDTVEKDKVIRQDPDAGTKVAQGTEVTYVLSLGVEDTSVPDVTGQTQGNATTTLNNAGFTVTTEDQYSNTVASGNVISQTPTGGSKLKNGGTVHLAISLGAKPTVPSVSGMDQYTAQNTLQNAGFTVSSTYQYSSTVASGNVISQTPVGGSDASGVTYVSLVVSSGPDPSTSSSTTGGGTSSSGSGSSSTGTGSGSSSSSSSGSGSGTGSSSSSGSGTGSSTGDDSSSSTTGGTGSDSSTTGDATGGTDDSGDTSGGNVMNNDNTGTDGVSNNTDGNVMNNDNY